MKRTMVNEKLAIEVNPLATPFRTSIELIVLPITGIMNTISPRYRIGIFTSPNKGNARLVSYAPNSKIGAAQNASAAGLNHPPITLLSSIIPTKNAKMDVTTTAKISTIGKKR